MGDLYTNLEMENQLSMVCLSIKFLHTWHLQYLNSAPTVSGCDLTASNPSMKVAHTLQKGVGSQGLH